MTCRTTIERAIGRRPVLAGMAGLLAGAGSLPAVAAPAPAQLSFRVMRKGDDIGRHNLVFAKDGDDLLVSVDIEIKVTLAFIPVYHYAHRIEERWRSGRLIAIDSTTDDDGDKMFLRGVARGDSFDVEGSAGMHRYSIGVLATSWWNPATVTAGELMHSHDGQPLKIGVTPRGEESISSDAGALPATRYAIDGEQPLDIWYDRQRTLARIRFAAKSDGSIIDYVRT